MRLLCLAVHRARVSDQRDEKYRSWFTPLREGRRENLGRVHVLVALARRRSAATSPHARHRYVKRLTVFSKMRLAQRKVLTML